MSMVDDLRRDTEPKQPWQMCGVKWALQVAQGVDRDALTEALAGDKAADKIADAIRKHLSLNIGGETVRRHRRGSCRCPR